MKTLREQCLDLLAYSDLDAKIKGTLALNLKCPVGANLLLTARFPIPGRPASPVLVPHTKIKSRSHQTAEGHAALIHSIVHIELNAVDLALDICWRFPELPDKFYIDWAKVAVEEAYHFSLLRDHLMQLGFAYGDFQAHNGLWEMAERTRDDLLARLGLVPRTAEARGLDASPAVKAKLLSIGDGAGASILDIILRDEIGHVAVGNHWYRYLCDLRGLDHVAQYRQLVDIYRAPKLRGPFNIEARRLAGFSEDELNDLLRP